MSSTLYSLQYFFLAPEVIGSGRDAADLSRRQALAGDFSDWLMVMDVACAPSQGRGGSHDLNCPITIVVRLYLGGLLYKECVNRASNDCLVDKGRL